MNHWENATRFLSVAGCGVDNNPAERALRRPVLHRKNSLFFKNEHGASVGDILMSLVETSELNAANPIEYLTQIGRNVTAAREQPEAWLPWTYRATIEAQERAALSGQGVILRQASGKQAARGDPL